MNIRHLVSALIITLLSPITSLAQTASMLEQLLEENQATVDAVVMYPEDVREHIFQVATRPDMVLRVSNLQAHTKRAFEALIEPLSKEDQQKLYELSRYPNLVLEIVQGSLDRTTLEAYPSEIHPVARDYAKGKKRLLAEELLALQQHAQRAFEGIIRDYPKAIQASAKALAGMPEILSILTANIQLTTALGDVFLDRPEKVRERAAELQLEVARQEAQSTQLWADSLRNDSEASQEAELAAAAFRQEDDKPAYVYQAPASQPGVTVVYAYHPYSYWFGYPTWYRHAHWHYYPAWHHTGFYISSNNTVIIVGTPSYHYTTWYFHGHHHHYTYSHLSYHYARHYHVHIDIHRHGGGFHDAVRDWERENRDHLPRDWAERRSGGPEWFQEYGKFEERFGEHRRRNPDQNVNRESFRQRPYKTVQDRRPTNTRKSSISEHRQMRSASQQGVSQQFKARERHQRSWETQRQTNRADRTLRPGKRQ